MSNLNTKGIRVHCSASNWGDAEEINKWHIARGWSGIGYHLVILNGFRDYVNLKKNTYQQALDGKIEPGREQNKQGAHCLADGMNSYTLGVCLVGNPGWYNGPEGEMADSKYFDRSEKAYMTKRQLSALVHALATFCTRYKLDPMGKFKTSNGEEHYVLDQHSAHDKGKPYCASLNMAEIRKLVDVKVNGEKPAAVKQIAKQPVQQPVQQKKTPK